MTAFVKWKDRKEILKKRREEKWNEVLHKVPLPVIQLPLLISLRYHILHTNHTVPVKDSWSGDDEGVSSSAPLTGDGEIFALQPKYTPTHAQSHKRTHPPEFDLLKTQRAVKHTAKGVLTHP